MIGRFRSIHVRTHGRISRSSDRAKRSPANPKLDTLLALASQLGIRIVIDVAHPDGMVIRIDDQG